MVTPGAAQALLKGSGVSVGREVVVAGAGPFLLPVAAALAEAGARVVGVVEAGDPRRYLARRSGLPASRPSWARRPATRRGSCGIACRTACGTRSSAAHGQGTVSGWTSLRWIGTAIRVRSGGCDCDAVAVGYGFTANLDLALALGARLGSAADGGLAIATDADGRTSVPGVYAAGEITGVGGARSPWWRVSSPARAAAQAAGTQAALSRRDVAALRRRAGRLRAFADAMHAAHAVPAGWASRLTDPTIVCRCEEVPYGRSPTR